MSVAVLVCIQHSAELTDLEAKTRTLAETAALQDMRIRELEKQRHEDGPARAEGDGSPADPRATSKRSTN